MIKKIVIFSLLLTLWSCKSNKTYHPGGPYYYKYSIANYTPLRPNGEITKIEADQLARDGYAYYIAYFNDNGRLTQIQKLFNSKVQRTVKLSYRDGILYKSVTIDQEGKKNEKIHQK
jgi:hypothetical protein